jgi:hypothetical protein
MASPLLRAVIDHYRDPDTYRLIAIEIHQGARAAYRTLNHFGDLFRRMPKREDVIAEPDRKAA